jgi:hypothetical protein
MRQHACTEHQFLKDVTQHVMTVIRDDGVNRHIRFKRPDSSTYWFDLITWPGTLCIDGDCGTYVFRRLEDMFQFFRTDRDWLRDGATLGINPGYWGEKLQAKASYGGYMEFSERLFREAVKSEFDAWVESEEPSDKIKDQIWEELEDRVLSYVNDGAHDAVRAAMDFEPDDGEVLFEMRDFYDHRLDDYTFHFIWCCYAIAWGVKTYDEANPIMEAA